ncbi:hydroxypyruvate isomerase [Peribacillus cavernae]|uniref:Hydroxypyruvate isomerase n=1 Tax=Peribacillus cavernae TaxID=1674310 RepID=A0A3S0U944_9BACI|nr:TIM barrel protein [Peribacillus cavernae]MDQ0221123.1 hydroxypyruvate isomerase [Peribacillus cavernae]RUQ32835.1 hydroxypyruvate isomerase [Peribacillus cavernae]
MHQFAANLSTIFTEVPFLERFKKAKQAGFSLVECQFPYRYSIEDIKKQLVEHQQSMVLINLPPGDWVKGDRGLAIASNRSEEFRESVDLGIHYATNLKTYNIHCMSGILATEEEKEHAREVYIKNIKYAAAKMAEHNLTLMIEPINKFDIPGYFLSNFNDAVDIVQEVQLPNVKLQYDFYHIQRMQGNLMATFQRYSNLIGHIQIADVPGRHQPGTGEIHYQQVFNFLKNSRYEGYIGLEYVPKEKSEDSFGWLSSIENGGGKS